MYYRLRHWETYETTVVNYEIVTGKPGASCREP